MTMRCLSLTTLTFILTWSCAMAIELPPNPVGDATLPLAAFGAFESDRGHFDVVLRAFPHGMSEAVRAFNQHLLLAWGK